MSATLAANTDFSRTAPEPRDMPSDGYFFTPTQLAALGSIATVIATAGGFAFKWFWDRMWKKADADAEMVQRVRDSKVDNVAVLIGKLSEQFHNELRVVSMKMADGFGEVRGLINKQDVTIREIETKLKFQDKFNDEIREVLESIPKQIAESRHLLRNQLHREMVHGAVMKRKGESFNPMTDSLPPEMSRPTDDDNEPTND